MLSVQPPPPLSLSLSPSFPLLLCSGAGMVKGHANAYRILYRNWIPILKWRRERESSACVLKISELAYHICGELFARV